MAEQITANATLQYQDSVDTTDSMQINDLSVDVASEKFVHAKQTIGTSEESLVIGETTSPGWFFAINRDSTNFIELRVGTGGAKFAKLLPGEFCFLRLGSGAQVPYAIADTAAAALEYLVINT